MKSSAVATGKRRSLLPAPKSSGAGPSVAASKTGGLPARKNKELVTASSTALPSTGLKVITNTTVGDSGSESKGSETVGELAGNSVSNSLWYPGGYHSGSESKQSQLRKPSNLQQSAAVTRKRPSSASSVLNRGSRELNESLSVTKTSLDSGKSVKHTAVKGAAVTVSSWNAETKDNRLFRGATSVSASQSVSSSTKQRKLPCSAETAARKLKVPTKCVSVGTTVANSSSPEIDSQAETVSNAKPVISTSSVTEIPLLEDIAAGATFILPESSSCNSVEDGFAAVVGQQKCDFSESLLGTVAVADVPDVLSSVTSLDRDIDDHEHLASSSGSLGILDDTDLLNTSLLSFDSCSAPSAAVVNDDETCHGNAPDEDAVPVVELGSMHSSSSAESNLPLRSSNNEVNMPSARPLSLMSNSSTDVGIVADCVVHVNESRSRQERPSSYLSTSSADTGMC